LPELDAHDLRRTFARLGYDAGVPVEQISKLLGHADVKTTMLYLGIDIDIESTVSDFIPISGD
jgi:integrase/recombinase XerD